MANLKFRTNVIKLLKQSLFKKNDSWQFYINWNLDRIYMNYRSYAQ